MEKKPRKKREYPTNRKAYCWDDEKDFINQLGKFNKAAFAEIKDRHRATHENGELYTRLELLNKYLWCIENVRNIFCKAVPKKMIIEFLSQSIEKEEGV